MVEQLRAALDHLTDRLSRLPESRLTGTDPGGRSPARDGHDLAQKLADAAAGIETRAQAEPDAARALPWLGPFAVANQLTVTGTDLWTAADGLAAGEAVWSGARRRDLGAVLEECAAALTELDRRI